MPFFFFSYAHDNASPYLDNFLDLLCREIRERTGLSDDVCFRDQEQLRTGDRWSHALADALRRSRVFVPLYSPHYFSSTYCCKEWHAFTLRLQHYTATRSLAVAPPLIVPVLWRSPEQGPKWLPGPAEPIQFRHAPLGETYAREGLSYLLQLDLKLDYTRVAAELAKVIIKAANDHPLPAWTDPLDLGRLPDGWTTTAAPDASPPTSGFNHVQFFIVAARRDEWQGTGVRNGLDAYRPVRLDWQPFYLEADRSLAALAQLVASREGFYSSVAEADPDLTDRLEEAGRRRHFVVLLVDPWSLHLPGCATNMSEYDRRDYGNCAVLLPWNNDDAETCARRDELWEVVRRVFPAKTAEERPLTFPGPVYSAKEFKRKLGQLLHELKARALTRGPVGRRALGRRAVARPQLVGPGGA
jgi:FxsC-like protein